MANYVLLERITVGAAGASSVSFNNIPQTGYTDLKLVYSTRVSGTGDRSMLLTFNGSTTGYSYRALYGTGSAAASGNASSQSNLWAGYSNSASDTNNTFSNCEVYVPNFTSTNAKSVSIDGVWETNASANIDLLSAGLWSIGTNVAITSVTFTPASGTLQQYSTFSLYALAAVGTTPTKAPKAIGGDIIQTDGTYWYHAFLSSGSFTPQTALSCDVLVVAGGGGGGFNTGAGGGGAGGLLTFTSQALTANTTQLVTVGAGGAGGTSTNGAAGGNSSFGSLTAAIGGGYGAGSWDATYRAGGNGGSGGGASSGNTGYGGASGGTGTSAQGNNGGATSGRPSAGGGGGGAGAVGADAANGAGGNGGNGVNTYSTWATATSTGVSGYYAGGGGGSDYPSGYGVGGAGGGGNGGAYGSTSPTAGTANTGSGGGAGQNGSGNGYGASGGSGIVIIRYAY